MDPSQDGRSTQSAESESVKTQVDQLSGTLENASNGPGAPAGLPRMPARIVWLHRISLVVLVVFCIELGMLLAILPWTTVWAQNSYLGDHPTLRAFSQQNFVRGLVTGFGLVDIWIGIWEAVHYRDPARKQRP